jgi:hypothetical protein
MRIEYLIKQFPFLKDLASQEIIFEPDRDDSLAAVIVKSNVPYRPGVYFVYANSKDKEGKLLYVGIAGSDKNGRINSHQLPKRLLAVCYPPEKYLEDMPKKNMSRNELWPVMMKKDGISAINILCFFSPIGEDNKVKKGKIPLELEKLINAKLKEQNISQPWSKRHNYEI